MDMYERSLSNLEKQGMVGVLRSLVFLSIIVRVYSNKIGGMQIYDKYTRRDVKYI
jgi:hypothetical protein